MDSTRTSRETRSLVNRRNGLIKKASELATLCDADVCLVSYSPFDDGRPVTWPSDGSTVRRHIDRFSEAKRAGVVKQSVSSSGELDDERNIEKQDSRPSSWRHVLDHCSRVSLTRLASHLEEKLSTVNRKIGERGDRSVENQVPVTNDRTNGTGDSTREREVVNNRRGDGCGAGNADDGFKRSRQTARIDRCGGSSTLSVKKRKIARDEDSRKGNGDGPSTKLELGLSTTGNREKEEASASVQLSSPPAGCSYRKWRSRARITQVFCSDLLSIYSPNANSSTAVQAQVQNRTANFDA